MGLLGLFAGLCAVFALITTIADAWREHAARRWPPATAHIESCTVDPYQPFGSGRHRPVWHIDCRISYTANDHQVETWVRSRSTASGWGGHLDQMREWVEEHAPGSSMVVHYDPADISKVVLAATDMPDAGPRTPNNLVLLSISAVTCAVLLTIVKRRRTFRPK